MFQSAILDWPPPVLYSDVSLSRYIFLYKSLAGYLSGRAQKARNGPRLFLSIMKVMKLQTREFSGLIWSDVFSVAETIQEILVLSLQPHPGKKNSSIS